MKRFVMATMTALVLMAGGVAGACGGMPMPPTLNAPQNPIAFGADPTGVHDSWPAFKAALNAGDLDVKAGTYLLNVPVSNVGYTPPSPRNFYCENPYGGLPASPSSPVVIKIPTYSTSQEWQVFHQWGNVEIYGCEFEGYHYPNVTWSGDSNLNAELIANFTVSNVKLYGNGFDGWPGGTGPIEAGTNQSLWQAGNVGSNYDISYNRFSNSNGRAFEADMGTNLRFTHNTLIDTQMTSELVPFTGTQGKAPQVQLLVDSNTFSWVHGIQGGSSSGWNNLESVGAACHGSKAGNYCNPGETADYSQNTFSNNATSGAQNNWQLEDSACLNGELGIIKGVYRNNTCAGGCSIQCAPGNPASNVWGAGSNQ